MSRDYNPQFTPQGHGLDNPTPVVVETLPPSSLPGEELPIVTISPDGGVSVALTLTSVLALGAAIARALNPAGRLARELAVIHTTVSKLRLDLAELGGSTGANRVVFLSFSNGEVYLDGVHKFRLNVRASWESPELRTSCSTLGFLNDSFYDLISSPLFSRGEPYEGWSGELELDWVDSAIGEEDSYWALVTAGGRHLGVIVLFFPSTPTNRNSVEWEVNGFLPRLRTTLSRK